MAKRTARTIKEEEAAVGSTDVAPPSALKEDPSSILSRTSTTLDEQDALASRTFATVDINDLEMRIGLLARIILEHYLRSREMGAKEKCDVALRAITTLEGSKQEVTWRDELRKKPTKRSLEAYKRERADREERLKKILLRREEVRAAQAELALNSISKKDMN